MSVADSLSFVECWASRWLLKKSIVLDWIDFQRSTWKSRHLEMAKTTLMGKGSDGEMGVLVPTLFH